MDGRGPAHLRRRPRGDRWGSIATALAGAGLIAGGLVLWSRSSDADVDGIRSTADQRGQPVQAAETPVAAEAPPAEVFEAAAQYVRETASFTYEGTTRLEAPNGLEGRLTVLERRLEGEVRSLRRAREVAHEPDGSVLETIVWSVDIWSRSTAFPDEIDNRPWQADQPGLHAVDAIVTPADGACTSVDLTYTDPDDPVGSYLWLSVMPAGCAVEPPGAQPFDVDEAPAMGVVTDGIAGGVVYPSDDAAIAFETDLTLDDLAPVLATLGPLDLRTTLEPIEGIPSTPV